MANTTVSVIRNNVTLYTGIDVQIDHQALETQAYQSGQTPYDAYMIHFTFDNPDIQHNDKLQDEAAGGLTYRVTGQPRQYPNGHCEVKAIVKATT